MCYRELCLGIWPGLPEMEQALWTAAPGFAGDCLIDEINLTEPNIPEFVKQNSQQCQLQGWDHRKILYGTGRHPVEACHRQSLLWVWLCYNKGFQLLGEARPKVTDGQGLADPVAHRSVGILVFNPGCNLGFAKWKRWPWFQFKSCMIVACLETAAACILRHWYSGCLTATLVRMLLLGLESSLSNNFNLFSSQVAEQSDSLVKIPERWHAAWKGAFCDFDKGLTDECK